MKRAIIKSTLCVLLLFSCGLTALTGCNEIDEPELSDKEMLINQLSQDFNVEDGEIKMTLDLFAQDRNISSAFSLDVKISNGEITIIRDVYDSVKKVDDYQAMFDEHAFESANKTVPEEKVSEIKDKIKNNGSCYLLECESGDDLPIIAVYKIDGAYYFLTIYPDDGHVMRIHYSNIK